MDFEQLSKRYTGEVASAYDVTREGGAKWRNEQRALERLLSVLPSGLTALDVPVGTGRLFPFYARYGFAVTGIDISADMLAKAQARADVEGLDVTLRTGDIRSLPVENGRFDLVSCIRFLNWVGEEGLRSSLAELTRASREYLLVGIRHLTAKADFRPNPTDFIRVVRQSLGHAHARARRSGLVYHRKDTIVEAFENLKLSVVQQEVVEKRSDGTDYLFYLLRKQRSE